MTEPMLHTETVHYQAGDTALQGYLAYDTRQSGPRPGVLVIHEWWGLNDYIRYRARLLAEQGYTALAIDMYGDGETASDPERAGQLMHQVLGNTAVAGERLRAGYERLCEQPQADRDKLAAIGYCFGGAMALHAARIGMDLAAVVSFHGALGALHNAAPGTVRARVLVCHGGADAMVSDADVEAFRNEMDAARADYRVVVYDGALHGFSNREATANGEKYRLPLAYDEDADRRSWQQMMSLFNDCFG